MQPLFERARRIADGDDPGAADDERFLHAITDRWIADAPPQGSGY